MSEEKKPESKAVVVTPVTELRRTLEAQAPEFEKALPPHIPIKKFIRIIQTAIATNPKLVEASRHSFLAACQKAAQDGLLPDGREAAFVTFRNNKSGTYEVQYLPMTQGILKKVRNSGELSSINSQVVYEKDEFDYWVDEMGEHLKHKPLLTGERGKRLFVYAVARTKDGGVYVEAMTEDQVMAVKAVSRAKDGPWQGDFEDEMWRKSAIRRLSKRLPMSTDLEQTLHADDDMYDFNQEAEEKASVKKPTRLAKIVEKTVEKIETPAFEKLPFEEEGDANEELGSNEPKNGGSL